MAAGSETKRKGSARERKQTERVKRKRHLAAKKGWETRRRREEERRRAADKAARKRKKAAQKAAKTRAENRAREQARRVQRSLAARRGAAKRKARALVQERLEAFRDVVVQAGRMRGELEPGDAEGLIGPAREAWHEAKAELWDAVDYDFFEYQDVLDDVLEDVDVDWEIAYAPAETAS